MEKTFDCLKMKDEIQAKIYEEIKDLPSDKITEYFRNKANKSAWWRALEPRDKAQWERATTPSKK